MILKSNLDVIIPTLNCASSLESCLQSISVQTFKKYQIFIIDGGSTDSTIAVAKKYHCHVLNNPLKTGEAGKAVGIQNSGSDLIALIDSDNILPSTDWFDRMLEPFTVFPDIIGTEPWEYSYRSDGGFIERYSSLTGVNDPYSLIAGNFDRKNYLSDNWTNLKLQINDYPNFQLVTLNPGQLTPTIGANGTIFRRKIFAQFKSKYFFDIDILSRQKQVCQFSKVKIGIIHTFCESSISKFYRKQLRRATDLYSFQHLRSYPLVNHHLFTSIKFILYVITFVPPWYDSLRGYFKKPDPAWFFHPLACYLTLIAYSLTSIKQFLGILKPLNRQRWVQ